MGCHGWVGAPYTQSEPVGEMSGLTCRETTALQRKLETMAQQIGNFGLAAAVFTLAAMAGQFTWHTFYVDGQAWDYKYLTDYLSYVITAITIVVGRPSFLIGSQPALRISHAWSHADLSCVLSAHSTFPIACKSKEKYTTPDRLGRLICTDNGCELEGGAVWCADSGAEAACWSAEATGLICGMLEGRTFSLHGSLVLEALRR